MTNAVMVRPGELAMDVGGVPERVRKEHSVKGEAEQWGGGAPVSANSPAFFFFFFFFFQFNVHWGKPYVGPFLQAKKSTPDPRPHAYKPPWMFTASLTALHPQRPGQLLAICEPSVTGG